MPTTHQLNAVGLLCPLPVLKIRKRMKNLSAGELLLVLADDPAATIDIPHYCAEQGHEFIQCRPRASHQEYLIRKVL
ncbi:MAG: sulfurtransferase TusA family protein [Rhodobacteraceae bacterium]|nr:sulfurtransferase TusA family protein [Paracoccaceae bacterium]